MRARGALITFAIVAGLMFSWGLSWAAGGFPQCASAEDFLAATGWLMAGILLSFVVGAMATGYLSAAYGFVVGLLLGVAVVVVIGLSAGLGGAVAERASGCPGATRSSGELFAMVGFAGAVMGLLIGGLVHWVRRRPSAT